MQNANPYATPNAPVNDMGMGEFGNVKILSANGRMGRVRYFFYSMLVGIIGLILLGLSSILFSVSPLLGAILVFIIYAGMIVISFLLTIQRCHDFNMTGWLSLLLLVPLAPLVFYFIPGTKGPNQFGPPPPPNSKGVIAGAIILPIIMVVLTGILASISIPAYQKYLERAQAANGVNIQQNSNQ